MTTKEKIIWGIVIAGLILLVAYYDRREMNANPSPAAPVSAMSQSVS